MSEILHAAKPPSHSIVFHLLNCITSGAMLSYFSALFFLEVDEWTRGWAYPKIGPIRPGQPACLAAKMVQITCGGMEEGRAAAERRGEERRQ